MRGTDVLIKTANGRRVAYNPSLKGLSHLALCTTCSLRNTCCYKEGVITSFENHGLFVAVYECPDYKGK